MRAFYDRGDERDRLSTWSWLEFARTKELLLRHLPPAPARVLDVGGGPGAYAVWLAELGYDVHLVDPVPLHVEQAAAVARVARRPFTVAVYWFTGNCTVFAPRRAMIVRFPSFHQTLAPIFSRTGVPTFAMIRMLTTT